jgi:hypothetical protein
MSTTEGEVKKLTNPLSKDETYYNYRIYIRTTDNSQLAKAKRRTLVREWLAARGVFDKMPYRTGDWKSDDHYPDTEIHEYLSTQLNDRFVSIELFKLDAEPALGGEVIGHCGYEEPDAKKPKPLDCVMWLQPGGSFTELGRFAAIGTLVAFVLAHFVAVACVFAK